jgi:phage tail sheath gpL-like
MGISASVIARVVGIDPQFVNLSGDAVFLLPQQVALIGQGSTSATYATTPIQFFTSALVGQTYGFGSPLHLAALKLLPAHGGGLGTVPLTVYPLIDGAGAAAAGQINPTGTQVGNAEYTVVCGGIRTSFSLLDGANGAGVAVTIAAAMQSNLNNPAIASVNVSDIDIDLKWQGLSGNDVTLSVEGPTTQGMVWGFTQPVGGTLDPDVDAALTNIGTKWETMVVSCFPIGTEVELDKYVVWGEPRWGATTRTPAVVITGSNSTNNTAINVIGNTRKPDRVNALVRSPGSPELPCQIAAAAVAKMAVQANSNPPVDYAGQSIAVVAGAEADQLNLAERNTAILAGISSVQVADSVVQLSDTVTYYHPDGEIPPAYRYVVDIVKLQNLVYNLALIFEADEWKGAPLIPNIQPTTNPAARKPKDAIAAVASMINGAGLQAIISDPETAKKTITAVINSTNPKRLDVAVTLQLSGNTNVINVDMFFGFFFETPPLV